MADGTIMKWDPDTGKGWIDADDDRIPFETDGLADEVDPADIAEGDRVRFEVEGGLAGVTGIDIRPI